MKDNNDEFIYKYENNIDKNQLVKLFESVGWKTAEYPNRLYNAIKNSEYVMTVWNGENLIGLISGNYRWLYKCFYYIFTCKSRVSKNGIRKNNDE